MEPTRQLCTFALGGLCLGVDVRRVQEVIGPRETTRVPLAPPFVRGLINLRGEIVTAIDLRPRLERSPAPADALPTNVVLRAEDGAVSLCVDEIGGVVEVPATGVERLPETLPGPLRELVSGVCQLADRLLLVLDPDKLLAGPSPAAPLGGEP
jgi:purine-binding chemotaxis protein CheW